MSRVSGVSARKSRGCYEQICFRGISAQVGEKRGGHGGRPMSSELAVHVERNQSGEPRKRRTSSNVAAAALHARCDDNATGRRPVGVDTVRTEARV